MSGFKRAQVLEILAVTCEMLRYWREKLDPTPKRKEFSVRAVLGLFILKVLIKQRGISVNHLAKFNISKLFNWCEYEADIGGETRILVIDNSSSTFRIESAGYKPFINDYEIDLLPLQYVFLDFRKRMFSFGQPSVQNIHSHLSNSN